MGFKIPQISLDLWHTRTVTAERQGALMYDSNETRFKFGPFDLDLMRGALQDIDGNEIKLRPKRFQLLSYFIVNSGRLISKSELINQLWSNTIVGDDSLAQCVSELRTAIRDFDRRIIKTVARRGYLFAELPQ